MQNKLSSFVSVGIAKRNFFDLLLHTAGAQSKSFLLVKPPTKKQLKNKPPMRQYNFSNNVIAGLLCIYDIPLIQSPLNAVVIGHLNTFHNTCLLHLNAS